MSIFKTKWIILKIQKINQSEFLYTIFTKEYWKIKCNKKFSKKEKSLDLWYIVNFEISTKENQKIHKIKNIKILSDFFRENKNFVEINSYLIILSIILKKIPDWITINELFELLELLNLKSKNIDEIKLILFRLKVISILWELNENHKNNIISKILKFINNNKINKVIKLTWINDNIKKELEII